jgi:hypothetical protein
MDDASRQRPTFHWQVTVRVAGDPQGAEAVLRESVLPLLGSEAAASHASLAACINCAGEYTFMADWSSTDAVIAFVDTAAYRAALRELGQWLRVEPKRELWRLLV